DWKLMRHILTYITVVLFFPLSVVAQSGSPDKARSGSVYSSIGLGIPVDQISSYTEGMGLTGVSMHNPYAVSGSNPALWGVSAYSQGVITMGLESLEMEDNSGTATGNTVSVDNFQVVFPVIRSRLGVSFGFSPITRSSYNLFQNFTVTPDLGAGQDPIQVINDVRGAGGVNRMELGIGFRVNNNLAIGYAGSYNFAALTRNVNVFFDSPRFNPIDYTDKISGNTFGNRFGVYGRVSDLLRGGDEISIGGSLRLPLKIGTSRKATSFRNVDGSPKSVEVFDTDDYGPGNIEIPLEFNIGLTYYPSRFVSFSAEYSEQRWSEARFSYDSGHEQYFVDRSKMGAGLQIHPYRRDGIGGFFSNFKYSAGVTLDDGHLMINNQIETLMFHTGLGLMSPQGASSIDMSFQLGFRGSDTQNIIKETIWGVKLSLNLAEWMFEQSRFQ
ncbi:MAG: hypothetical protein WD599_03910, partial [Balneolaceae bacterium]